MPDAALHVADSWLRLVDRLPAPSLAALCAAWPEVLAGLARDVPVTMAAGWGWERPGEVDRIMRTRLARRERRTA